jgi:hypothetical protein
MLQQLPHDSREMDSTPYLSEMRRIYNASQSAGLYIGMTTEKKILLGDLHRRTILVLPSVQYLPTNVINEIQRWVESGGTLVVSPDSLLGDEYARPSQVARSWGLQIVRRELPRLRRGEKFVTDYNLRDLPRLPLLNENGQPLITDGLALQAAGMRQTIQCDPAAVIAHFTDGVPAIVRLRRGCGTIYWLAAPLVPESWSEFLSFVAANSGLKPELVVTREEGGTAPEVEYRVTALDRGRLAYFVNNSDQDLRIALHPGFPFTSIVDRRTEMPLSEPKLLLSARETAILQFR